MATTAPSATGFRVTGMTCQNCARHATEAIQSVPAVASVTVDLAAAQATVRWKPDAAPAPEAVIAAVKAAGYAAQVFTAGADQQTPSGWSPLQGWKFNAAVGGAATAILMLGEWGLGAGLERWFHWLGFTLALPVQVFCGARFYRGAWSQLKVGSSNMDTLVALGSTTAFAFSTWGLFTGWHGHLYFMEAAAIITLISVGHWLESLASANAARSLRALMHLAPSTARRLTVAATTPSSLAPKDLLRGLSLKSGGTPQPGQHLLSPHPDPLPKEREQTDGTLGESDASSLASALNPILPLPRGEGRGEGKGEKIFAKSPPVRGGQSPLPGILDLSFSARPGTAPLSQTETEIEVPVSELKPGDRVVLRPGDRVPVDGVVSEGESAVDESMLTGESLPVDKVVGSQLYAGTVNQDGRLVLRVEATGEATALANIIAVVQRAQSSRASIQRLGDRVSSVFVPVVVVLAVLTALWWGLNYDGARSLSGSLMTWLWAIHVPETALAAAFIQAAAVLIVACPCAMGLATPAAIMAGTNAAARRGILIRDGEALEKSGTITAVVFDKTGTITEGSIRVAGVLDVRGENDRVVPLEKLAAALARPSNHPLSRAVAKLAKVGQASSPAPSVEEWQELRGSGVRGRLLGGAGPLSGMVVQMGSLVWLQASGVPLESAETFLQEHTAEGATLLGLAAGGCLLGVIALRDTLDARAAAVLAQLVRDGKKVFLLTGDNRRTASAIAQQAGISADHVFAEVRPEQKADIVKQLQQRGERVAFVGDGINDAPALEQADLGIAVARASDVAREAADIILLKADLAGIPEALGLAQATLRTIKQNLFWAFFYNAAAIPLAMLGFLSPVLCAAAMGLSDVIVIGNALRLFRWKARE